MTFEAYKKASVILHDGEICNAIIKFVDAYMPPNGGGYSFKIVLHDKEFDCPAWLYNGIRSLCEDKKKGLLNQFNEL